MLLLAKLLTISIFPCILNTMFAPAKGVVV